MSQQIPLLDKNTMQKNLKIIICALFLLTSTVSCTPVTKQHGNFLQDYQIVEVKAGEHSRSDVLRMLGSPTTQSTFNNDIWYYIGQDTEKHGILDHEIVGERIVAVTFTKEGIVEKIEDLDSDRLNIPYARSKTPTHGNELTFMQQLLGNVGRFNVPQGSPTDVR